MRIDSLTVDPGHRLEGSLPVEIGDVRFELPVFMIHGLSPGPRLTITAGIHGGEYPCVEAACRLGRAINPKDVKGQILILPIANPVAFTARSIYITPVDGKNLNRQFPGKPDGTFTEAWADWIFSNAILGSSAYLDLHGGDMIEALVPFVAFDLVGDPEIDQAARQMAEAFGIRHALAKRTSGGPSGTTVGAAARAGVPALLAEAGGQGVWDEDSVEVLKSGALRVLQMLGILAKSAVDALATRPPAEIEWLDGWSWLMSEHDGLFYPTVSVGDEVAAGQDLGRIADVFGNSLQELSSPQAGTILFLVTSLAMRKGDPLLAVAY